MIRVCLIIISFLCLWSCSALHQHLNAYQNDDESKVEQSEFDYLLTEALKQKVIGNHNLTNNLLFKCLSLKPKSAVVYYELSVVYFAIGDKNNAVSFARKAVKYGKGNEWYLLQCAKLYQDQGRTDSVIYYFKRIVKFRPDKFDYNFKLSQLYFERKEFNKSLKVLNNLESRTGPSFDIFLAKYRNYLALSQNGNCLTVLYKALDKFPLETRIYGLLAEHYASIGNRDLALKNYTQLLSLDSDNERAYLSLIDFYRNTGQIKESFEISSKFVGNEIFSPSHKIEILSSYMNDKACFSDYKVEIKLLIDLFVRKNTDDLKGRTLLADFYLKNNDLTSARTELEFLLSKSKSDILVWEQLLFVLNSMNDYHAIFDFSEKGISYFNSNPLFYLYRGISSFQLKRYKEGISSLNEGLKFSNGSKQFLSKFYSYLGESYHAIKDSINSDLNFEKCIKVDPNNVIVLNNYSYYLSLRSVKLDSALKYMVHCIELEPKNATFLDTYAWVLFKSGRKYESKLIIEKALSYGGLKNANILEHYCEILIELNMRDNALSNLKKIIDLGKDSPRIRKMLNISI